MKVLIIVALALVLGAAFIWLRILSLALRYCNTVTGVWKPL